MNYILSNRQKFFLGHFSLSCLIALAILIWVFFVWYPFPLAKAVGVTHIFLMMLAIDVIVGPLLGLLVYKEGKKTLKFDLTVIILIQLSALYYGVYSIAQGRPAWLVYNVDRFELVRKNEIVEQHIHQAKPQFQQISWFKPQFVAVEFSKDAKQRSDDMFAEVLGGVSLAQRPERYIALVKVKDQMQQRSQKLELLQQYNDKSIVEKTLAQYPKATAFLPMKASSVDMTILVDPSGEVVKIVDLRPWQ